MALDPVYAKAMADDSGVGRESYPVANISEKGDKVRGKVIYVGETFQKDNLGGKYYDPEKDPEWKRYTTTKKIVLELSGGEKVALWLNKTKQFAAVGAALLEHDLSEVPVGCDFGMKNIGKGEKKGNGQPPSLFEAKIFSL